jgi:cbb3-type cytochrome oxidase maturation protein
MEIINYLIPLALLLGLSFVGLFIWATKSGQFDDLETPSRRMLFEDEDINENKNERKD